MSRSLNFVVSAPGKVILFGEHSVLYSQPALATSINRRTTLKFNVDTSNHVTLLFKNLHFNVEISIAKVNVLLENIVSSCNTSGDGLVNLIKVNLENIPGHSSYNTSQRLSLLCVFYLLYSLLYVKNYKIGGFKIEIDSELVIGAGTGSSASFSVCLAAALFRYAEFISDRLPNADAPFTDEQKSVINNWAFSCEEIIHGKASGVDNFVCTYGSMVNISFNDDLQKSPKPQFRLIPNTIRLRVLLVDSGVNRNTVTMVKKVAELNERTPTITKLVFNTMGEITKTAVQLLNDLTKQTDEKSEEFKKLFTKLEDLVSINHGLLISLGVSHRTLNEIVETATNFGLKSKLTGAGGGGYAFILVPPYFPEKKVEQCKSALEAIGFNVVDSKVGEKGLEVLSSDVQ